MKEYNAYLVQLLYDHDCVIIPGFGGFVARHIPSGADINREIILPPAKNILFNKNLINNDGLLANFIMEQSKCSFTEANRYVEDFILEIKNTLSKNHRYEIEHLGALFLDHENNVQFQSSPDVNFLMESFGLYPVYAKPLINIVSEKKSIQTKDRITESKEAVKIIPQKSKIKNWVIAAVTLPIAGAALFFSLSNAKVVNAWEAAIKPFTNAKSFAYTPKDYLEKEFRYHAIRPAEIHPDINGYGSFKLNKEGHFFWVNISDTLLKSDKTQVVKIIQPITNTNDDGPYQIVMGCFAVHDNAERLIRTLSGRNIQAYISGQNKNGLYIVSSGSFTDIGEARAFLGSIRQNYPSAWLMNAK
jgi:hypothetical protein